VPASRSGRSGTRSGTRDAARLAFLDQRHLAVVEQRFRRQDRRLRATRGDFGVVEVQQRGQVERAAQRLVAVLADHVDAARAGVDGVGEELRLGHANGARIARIGQFELSGRQFEAASGRMLLEKMMRSSMSIWNTSMSR
jgi:hypothetical protein